MIFEIIKMFFTPLLTLIIGALGNQIINNHNSKKKQDSEIQERLSKIENAEKAILHETILKKCNQILMIKEVTPKEIDELEYLYQPYKAIGGNHRAEKAYNKVLDLPRVENHEKE